MIARRELLGGLSLLPAATMLPCIVIAAQSMPAFVPGDAPFRLLRRVDRELRDGARLVVERAWSIRFIPLGEGYRLEGKQTGVWVDAPAALDFLADMERARVENDMFPLLLGALGEIVGKSTPSSDDALGSAIEAVRERLTGQFTDGQDRAAAEWFMAELQRAGELVLASWPAMLFAPGSLDHAEDRPVVLPRGMTGGITVRTLATSDPVTGLMKRFERRIETRLGDSARHGLECFTLIAEM